MTDPRLHIALAPEPVSYLPPPHLVEGGGECAFLGRTRGERDPRHGPLILLRYTAYETMAVRVLTALAQEAIERHHALFVRVLHATGEVPIGAASVLVQVVSAHRADAFAACRMLIDRLKAEAPIWKNEVWADGTTWSRGQPIDPDAFADYEQEHPPPERMDIDLVGGEDEDDENEEPL